ncbi:MAG: succinylglutamate desuccinylase/aspartoacylase family protein [Acidobacteriota bacterium]|nr:MAG: succinylglutamate desuccinylase/aspartoacylase family protein [Acidobacteriota bacterium]
MTPQLSTDDRSIQRSDQGPGVVTAGDHNIASFIGDVAGPTLIVVGGLHGNENAGVIALRKVASTLRDRSDRIQGRVVFLSGNTRALIEGKRFIEHDLNRAWTSSAMSKVGSQEMLQTSEGIELTELDSILDSILITARGEVYVLDLHSTSADGMPFATVGDTLRNRNFAQQFPVAILLGIEEQLEGTMLEYLNNLGAVTLGFEGGQHYSGKTVKNHEALVWLALVNSGILAEKDVPDIKEKYKRLDAAANGSKIFEIRYRHPVKPEDDFMMDAGYNNFDPIEKGQALAVDRNGRVFAGENGVLLMPLYQKLGEDGFFTGRRIWPFWLWLSGVLRRIGVQYWVRILPGVRRDGKDPDTLIVNTSVARVFPLQIFHLLGFRRRRWIGKTLVVSRRKHDVISPFVRERTG